ncbi:633_t:CDS:2, partial [Entrophospora sp. SA101]
LKKIYASFIMRGQLTNKSKKSSYSDAREVVRQYILEKKWQQDGEYGSLTLWYEKIIKENDSLNILSYFCPLGIRIWKCESGHIRIAPTPMTPLILINGLEDFNTPFFDENKHLIGQISALFAQKDGFILSEHPNEPCQHSRVNIHECEKRKINHEEFIVSWPKILIFEITQRDNGSSNSSESLNFPLHLNSGCLNYSLLGRVYSTSTSGSHFYSRLIKNFNENIGIYKYDDLNGGIAILESNNPISLAGEQQLATLVAYNLEEDNLDYFNSKTNKLRNYNIEIPNNITSGMKLMEFFMDKSNQYHTISRVEGPNTSDKRTNKKECDKDLRSSKRTKTKKTFPDYVIY